MENKQSYNLNVVFAKGKCITDFFSNNTGNGENSRIHHWILCRSLMLMLIVAAMCGVGSEPVEQWDNIFGGANYEVANSVQQTSNGIGHMNEVLP